jgi:hypothetical protein
MHEHAFRTPKASKYLIFGVVGFATVLANLARAELRTFTIDPFQSSLTVGGNLYGKPYNQQGTGSFTSSYSGSIKLDVQPGNIQFVGGSVIDAGTTGNWAPQTGSPLATTTAPADYGAYTNDTAGGYAIKIYLASRNLIADLTSGVVPVSGGSFSADGINFGFTQGQTDWTVIINLNGATYDYNTSSLVGASANTVGGTGSLSTSNWIQTLTIPINVGIPIDGDGKNGIDSLFGLTGQLVATATIPQIPGDFNGDGKVDGGDFAVWQDNFSKSSEATLTQGDADGDGDVDGADFVAWQTHFPTPPAPGVSSVPEPASACLLLAALPLAAARLRRVYASRAAARGR